jgi:hypothetical protein
LETNTHKKIKIERGDEKMVGSESSLLAYTHNQQKKGGAEALSLLHGEEHCDGNACACFFWKQTHIWGC